MTPAAELDQLLLSFCGARWLKVARIAGDTLQALEERGVEMDGSVAGQIDARMAELLKTGRLEAQGDIKRWRYSEVCLPRGRVEATD
jgi:hypothetical protein